MMERGELEVRWNELPLSLQEMMERMEQNRMSIAAYAALARLRSKGYVVRHLTAPDEPTSTTSPPSSSSEFDVFSPGKIPCKQFTLTVYSGTYQKKGAVASFRLLLASKQSECLSIEVLEAAQRGAGDLPLRVGVVHGSEVIFYEAKLVLGAVPQL